MGDGGKLLHSPSSTLKSIQSWFKWLRLRIAVFATFRNYLCLHQIVNANFVHSIPYMFTFTQYNSFQLLCCADLVRRLLYIQSWTLLNSNRSITLIIKERLQTLLLNLQTAANGAALLVKPHMDLDYVREFDDVSFLFLCSGQLCFSCFGSDLLRFMISQVSRPFEISPHRSSISSGGRREFFSHHIMFESIFGF